MLNCILDNVLVKPDEIKISSKIYVPPQFANKMKHLVSGKVVSAGQGTDLLPMPVKVGDTVVYQITDGFDLEIEGEKYRVIKNYGIICAR